MLRYSTLHVLYIYIYRGVVEVGRGGVGDWWVGVLEEGIASGVIVKLVIGSVRYKAEERMGEGI